MRTRSVPLNALRAFEAAARTGSVSKAAAELLVTQGAVSRQIKKLELFVGADLLDRRSAPLRLTDAGKMLLPTLSSAFLMVEQSLEAVMTDRSVLRLQVAPTFAIRWLMPRVEAFRSLHPRLDLRVTTTLPYDRIDTHSFDAGILYGDGHWPGFDAVPLAREVLAPVCAPDALQSGAPLRRIEDLRGQTLLHGTGDKRDWPLWLDAAGVREPSARDGPAFETLELAVRAAEAGHGVALGDLSLIGDDIGKGRIVVPFGPAVESGRGTYFVSPASRTERPAIRAFREWILDNAPIARGDVEALCDTVGANLRVAASRSPRNEK